MKGYLAEIEKTAGSYTTWIEGGGALCRPRSPGKGQRPGSESSEVQQAEQEIRQKGYANPEALVTTGPIRTLSTPELRPSIQVKSLTGSIILREILRP